MLFNLSGDRLTHLSNWMFCVPPEDNVILSMFMYNVWNELVSLLKGFIFSYCNSIDYFYVTKPPERKKK